MQQQESNLKNDVSRYLARLEQLHIANAKFSSFLLMLIVILGFTETRLLNEEQECSTWI